MSFAPRLDALATQQRALWRELASVPPEFVLYGGTALALRYAHRPSVDFDFFSERPLDHAALDALPFVRGAVALQDSANTRTIIAAGVKVSFFGGLAFGRVGAPEPTSDGVVRVASLLDLGGTKIKALLQRVEAKDYLDIDALLRNGVALADILGAGRTLFHQAFNPLIAQKALCYFVGGDLAALGDDVKQRLVAAASRDVVVPDLPLVATSLT